MNTLQRPMFDYVGRGLITPLQRKGAQDFVSSSGPEAIRATIRQIIGTDQGELPWKPSFGSRIRQAAHKPMSAAFLSTLKSGIEESIRRWEPRATNLTVDVNKKDSTLTVRIGWSLNSKNVAGNNMLLGPDMFEIRI